MEIHEDTQICICMQSCVCVCVFVCVCVCERERERERRGEVNRSTVRLIYCFPVVIK